VRGMREGWRLRAEGLRGSPPSMLRAAADARSARAGHPGGVAMRCDAAGLVSQLDLLSRREEDLYVEPPSIIVVVWLVERVPPR
jgi:hypothetical protein